MNRKRIVNVLKWLWIPSVIIFAGYYVYQNRQVFLSYLETLQFTDLLISGLAIVVAKLAVSELARLSVDPRKWRPSYGQIFAVVAISQLGKYLPGGIWHFAARIGAYKENAVSNRETGKALLIENLWLVSGALAFALITLSINPPPELMDLLPFAIPAWLLAVFPWGVLAAWAAGMVIIDIFLAARGKKFSILGIFYKMAVQAVLWTAFGISFFAILPDPSLGIIFTILGGFAASWIAGYIIIFAPGGIGVREIVLVTLFAPILPVSLIGTIVIAHRVFIEIIEILLGLFGVYLQKNQAQNAAKPQGLPGVQASQPRPEN